MLHSKWTIFLTLGLLPADESGVRNPGQSLAQILQIQRPDSRLREGRLRTLAPRAPAHAASTPTTAIPGAALSPRPLAEPETVELKTDDGSADGSGIVGDGLIIVNRLTPPRFPAIVKSLSFFIVEFKDEPDIVGKSIRVVLFHDPSGKGTPPNNPAFLIDRPVRITGVNRWIEVAIDGPTIFGGDLYVGYEAPDPYAGIGFACDTSGPQMERAWYSFTSGQTFSGPLKMLNGAKANVLMRARVQLLDAEADFELRTDDGESETGLIKAGLIAVNRLTPPSYPVQLKAVRLYFEQFNNLPSPAGKRIRVIAFTDKTGSATRPVANPAFEVDLQFEIPRTLQQWVDVAIPNGPVLPTAGDFYVGFQIPDADPQGVVFSADTDSAPQERGFYSEDGGETFRGPLALVSSSNQTIAANLLLRAVAGKPAGPEQPPPTTVAGETFELIANPPEAHLAGGPATASFQIRVTGTYSGPIALSAAVATPGAQDVSASLSAPTARVGDPITLEVRAGGAAPARTILVTVTARAGSGAGQFVRTRDVAVNVWRPLATSVVGADGGEVASAEHNVALRVPPGAWNTDQPVSILVSDSSASAVPNRASVAFRLQGIPNTVTQPLTVSLPPLDAGATGVMLVMERQAFLKNDGRPAPMHRLLPATGSGSARTAVIPALAEDMSLGDLNLWLVSGYEQLRVPARASAKRPAADTPEITFEISYPKEYATRAAEIADLLKSALEKLSFSPDSGLGVPFTGVPNNTIPISLVYLTDYLVYANHIRYADSAGPDIRFNIYRFDTPEEWAAYQSVPGHELFHVSQNYYGGSARDGFWTWMDDATATWFEGVVLNNPAHIPDTVRGGAVGVLASDNYVSFLRGGLVFKQAFSKGTFENPEGQHGYGASLFLNWLGRRNAPGLSLIGDLSRARTSTETPLEALNVAIRARGSELPDLWKQFIEDYLNGSVYPGRKFPTTELLTPAASSHTAVLFTTETEAAKTFPDWQAPDLGAEFYQVKFASPPKLPDLTDDVILEFALPDSIPIRENAGILVSSYQKQKVLGAAWDGATVQVPVRDVVNDRDMLLVTVANKRMQPPHDSALVITPSVRLAPPKTEILPRYKDFVGVIGGEYSFGTKNINVPAGATYAWDFGGLGTASTREAKFRFTRAGAFLVRVTVSGPGVPNRVEDSITIQIAPDTEIKRSEVSFYVYRVMSSKQKQASQNYVIRIYDSNGLPVASGESVARNGMFEATLIVGRTYSVEVDYQYTLPPCSGKTPRRTFTVIDGLNWVEIETASCGA